MKLYKEASLMMLPTSVKDGKLYSIFPQPKPLSGELVTNGGFDTDSDWDKGTGWSIEDGKAIHIGSTGNLTSNASLSLNNIYKIVFDIVSIADGVCNVYDNGTATTYASFDDIGTKTIYITKDSNSPLSFRSNSSNCSIDNISVVEVDQAPADFDFSRGADRATRVTEQGLVRPVEIVSDELVQNGDFEEIGDELVTNGDFSDGSTGWTFTTGATLTSNGAKITHTPTAGAITQTSILEIGKIYKLTYEVKEEVSGGLKINSAVDPSMVTTVGNHTKYFEADLENFSISRNNSSNNDITIDNISVKEVGQNWTFNTNSNNQWSIAEGQKASYSATATDFIITSNVLTVGKKYRASFDISDTNDSTIRLSVTSAVGGAFNDYSLGDSRYTTYLIAGTNYLRIGGSSSGATFSIDNISIVEVTEATDIPRLDWSGECPVLLLEPQRTNLVTYSEDFSQWSLGTGGISIDTGYLAPDGSNNATKVTMDSNFSTTALSLNIGLGTTETRAIYARTVSGTGQAHLCSYNGNTNNLFTITEEWQRFEVNGAISTGAVSLYAVDFRGSTDLNEIIIWGAQAEDGSYATSYIPTRGQAATRAADTTNPTGLDISDFHDGEDFTLFIDLAKNESLVRDNSDGGIRISTENATAGSLRIYRASSSATTNRVVWFDNDSVQVPTPVQIFGDSPKVVIRRTYENGEWKVFVNGSVVSTQTNTNYNPMSNVKMWGAGSPQEIKQFTLFDTALSDNECINLTSI